MLTGKLDFNNSIITFTKNFNFLTWHAKGGMFSLLTHGMVTGMYDFSADNELETQ
jgi:hypothetical protein